MADSPRGIRYESFPGGPTGKGPGKKLIDFRNPAGLVDGNEGQPPPATAVQRVSDFPNGRITFCGQTSPSPAVGEAPVGRCERRPSSARVYTGTRP